MGEKAGHPFRGNQFTASKGGGGGKGFIGPSKYTDKDPALKTGEVLDQTTGEIVRLKKNMPGDHLSKNGKIVLDKDGEIVRLSKRGEKLPWGTKMDVLREQGRIQSERKYPDTGKSNPITGVQRSLMAKADADRKEINASAERAKRALEKNFYPVPDQQVEMRPGTVIDLKRVGPGKMVAERSKPGHLRSRVTVTGLEFGTVGIETPDGKRQVASAKLLRPARGTVERKQKASELKAKRTAAAIAKKSTNQKPQDNYEARRRAAGRGSAFRSGSNDWSRGYGNK